MKTIALLIAFTFCISIYTNNGLCQLPDEFNSKSVGNLNIKVTSNDVNAENKTTNITLSKSIKAIDSKLRFRYDIITPPVDDFYFVLALDSSTSLKTYPNAEQANAIIDAVPKFLANTADTYKNKNFNISVISWDNDTDFAYSSLNNKDPKTARLVPIQKANDELKNGIFKEIDNPNYLYRIHDGEGTNLSVALMGAIDVLKNNPIVKYHRTSKFIILVAGEDGEFDKCNESLLLSEAKKEGISIYAIVMNPSDNGKMLGHLAKLTEDKTQSCEGAPGELPDLLRRQLEKALAQAISEPAATNVTLVEPLTSYLKLGNEALIEVKGNGFLNPYKVKSAINNSSVYFIITEGLFADNITTITFDADISLRLPGSFNDNTPSFLNYTWLKEKDGFSISIPRNDVGMVSDPSVSSMPGASVPDASSDFGIMTILSLLIVIMIRRSIK